MSKKNKRNRPPKPRSVRWGRIIMWGFLGFIFTVAGTDVFILGELVGLLFALIRFVVDVNLLKQPLPDKDERIRESHVVGISFVGFIIGVATLENIGHTYWPVGLLVPVIAAFAGLLNYLWQERELKRPKPENPIDRPMSKSLAEHYEEAGLSESEVNVFRDTMAAASKHIHQLETTVRDTVELQDILNEHDTLNVIHAYFKAIVNEPKRMTEAAPFLYEQLPNLADLTHKYTIITRHEVKTADTYLVLNQAKDALSKLSATIRDEYTTFVRDDIEDLDTAVTLANKQLERQHNTGFTAADYAEEKEETK